MLAAAMCREVHFTLLPATVLSSTVPRCLFGPPNAKETAELLQEALDIERSKFARRWGVDPRQEDKENRGAAKPSKSVDRGDKSPRKLKSSPYSRQTNIHEFWRSRKSYDSTSCKKVMSSSNDAAKQTICTEKPAPASSSS